MLLEQILRNQQRLIDSMKAKVMTEIEKKLITIGVPVPAGLHGRMSKYLASVKGKPGKPKTYKELALLCIQMAMDTLEAPATRAPRTAPVVAEGDADDPGAISLTALLKGRGAQHYFVRLRENKYRVYMDGSTLVATGTIPDTWEGREVVATDR